MYCSKCGKKIDDSSAFCSYCGHNVGGAIDTKKEERIIEKYFDEKEYRKKNALKEELLLRFKAFRSVMLIMFLISITFYLMSFSAGSGPSDFFYGLSYLFFWLFSISYCFSVAVRLKKSVGSALVFSIFIPVIPFVVYFLMNREYDRQLLEN
jgi:hypothetical protein